MLREHDPNFDDPNFDSEISRDSPEWYQLHLATERLRAPEIYFQPSIIGCDQAGISETLDFILKKYDHDTSTSLASNVFVTGKEVLQAQLGRITKIPPKNEEKHS